MSCECCACTPSTFTSAFREMQTIVHQNARAKGFWESPESPGLDVAARSMLIVTEIAEFIETFREKRAHEPSEKVPGIMQAEEELADVVIRCMDVAGGLGLDLAEAIARKHAYNTTRPPKHGKAF